MTKQYLSYAIIWYVGALMQAARFLLHLPQLGTQALWITSVDILLLVGNIAFAIYYWVVYVKTKKMNSK